MCGYTNPQTATGTCLPLAGDCNYTRCVPTSNYVEFVEGDVCYTNPEECLNHIDTGNNENICQIKPQVAWLDDYITTSIDCDIEEEGPSGNMVKPYRDIDDAADCIGVGRFFQAAKQPGIYVGSMGNGSPQCYYNEETNEIVYNTDASNIGCNSSDHCELQYCVKKDGK